jgi:hypothetical protein
METTQLIMKRLKRVTLLVTVSLFTAFILVAGRSKDSKSESKIDETTCDTKEKETTLILYPNLPTPSNRQTNWAVPVMPSLWSGNQSATSLYDSPNTKYYCLITVANLQCKDYGENGVKTYRWNSQSGNNTMKIMVPESLQYRITIEYYEPCGPYWTGSNPYGRGKWYSEQTIYYQSSIAITQWAFLIKESC